jgi:hypothetical protein
MTTGVGISNPTQKNFWPTGELSQCCVCLLKGEVSKAEHVMSTERMPHKTLFRNLPGEAKELDKRS